MTDHHESRREWKKHQHDAGSDGAGGIGSVADFGFGLIDSAIARPYNATIGLIGPKMDFSRTYDHSTLMAKAGDMGGSVADILALSKITGGYVSKRLGMAAEQGLLSTSLAESPMLASTLTLGTTGALYGGVFTPGSLTDRAKNATVDFATFGAMGAAGTALGRVSSLGEAGSRTFVQDMKVGALSGIPGGIVNAEATSIVNGQGSASAKELTTSALYFGAFGGLMGGAAHGLGEAAKSRSWLTDSSTVRHPQGEVVRPEGSGNAGAPTEVQTTPPASTTAAKFNIPETDALDTLKAEKVPAAPTSETTVSKPFSYDDVTMSVRDTNLLKDSIAKNGDSQLGSNVFRFANRWATIMEQKMAAGQALTPEMARQSSLETGMDVQNYESDMARQLLVDTWKNGIDLAPISKTSVREFNEAVLKARAEELPSLTAAQEEQLNMFGSMLQSVSNSRAEGINRVEGIAKGQIDPDVQRVLLNELVQSEVFLRNYGVDGAESTQSIVAAMKHVPMEDIPRFVHYADQFHHDPWQNSVMSAMDRAVADGEVAPSTVPAWKDALSAKLRRVFPGIPESDWAISRIQESPAPSNFETGQFGLPTSRGSIFDASSFKSSFFQDNAASYHETGHNWTAEEPTGPPEGFEPLKILPDDVPEPWQHPYSPRAYKVVHEDGTSLYDKLTRYPLPTQAADGSWIPGKWVEPGHSLGVDLIQRVIGTGRPEGLYVTSDPVMWKANVPGNTTYEVQIGDAPSQEMWHEVGSDGRIDFAAKRIRLVRPLTSDEVSNIQRSPDGGRGITFWSEPGTLERLKSLRPDAGRDKPPGPNKPEQ